MPSQKILEKGFKAQARALVEFGYPDVTPAHIEAAHKKWVSGEDLEGNVIEMICEGAFKDYPEIFGPKGASK